MDKLLSQDINAVTVDQIETIMGLMDSLVNTISPAIKQIPYYRHLSIDDAKTAFSELADEVKEELQEVMREAELQRLAKEAEQRLADEATALQRLAEATRLAEAPLLTPTIAAPTLSISMLGAEGSITTDPIANPLLTDRLAQFTKNLSNLDEESHSDAVNVNDVLLNHGGHLEEFQEKQNMSTATEQEYQDALALFFKKKGLKINYNILSNVATRLRKIQTPSFMLEDDGLDEESCTSPVSHSDSDSGTVFGSNDSGDDTVFASEEDDNDTVYNNEEDLKKTLSPLITQEERATFLQGRSEDREFNDAELLTRYRDEIISLDGPLTEELSAQVNKRIENLEDLLEQEKELNEIDSLLAQLEEEGAQGLDPVQLPSKKTNRSRSSEENRQRHRAMKIINQSSAEKFIKEFQDTLELLIFNKVMQDKQLLDKNGCKTLLLSFFQTLDLNNDYGRKYVQMLPQLVDELLVVQEGLKERRQRVLDSSAEPLVLAQLNFPQKKHPLK